MLGEKLQIYNYANLYFADLKQYSNIVGNVVLIVTFIFFTHSIVQISLGKLSANLKVRRIFRVGLEHCSLILMGKYVVDKLLPFLREYFCFYRAIKTKHFLNRSGVQHWLGPLNLEKWNIMAEMKWVWFLDTHSRV